MYHKAAEFEARGLCRSIGPMPCPEHVDAVQHPVTLHHQPVPNYDRYYADGSQHYLNQLDVQNGSFTEYPPTVWSHSCSDGRLAVAPV